MRRPISRILTIITSVSMAVPPLSMPLAAQTLEAESGLLSACQASTGEQTGQAVADCLRPGFEALGLTADEAGARASLIAETGVLPESPATSEATGQTEGAAVEAETPAATTEAETQPATAEAETSAATAQSEAPAATPETETPAATVEAGTPTATSDTETPAANAEAETPAETADASTPIATVGADTTADAATPTTAAETETPAATAESETPTAEAEAETPAVAADTATPAATNETETPAATQPLTRQAARDACRESVGRGSQAAIRECIVDALEADGQTDLANRLRDRLASRVAEEVAARGEPELTAEQQTAADQTANALASNDTGGTAAAAAEDATGTVSEETVSAEDVRSSSEDFATGAVVTEDRGGLSNREKAVLGALGVLAVGTILNNRNRVVSNSGDRVVVQGETGDLQVLKDDDALLRQPGANVRTESFDDGSTRTIVTREDGSQVITIRDASLRVLRRVLVQTDGQEFTLIDDTAEVAPVEVSQLPPAPIVSARADDPLAAALRREAGLDRRFSLAQVRSIAEVRALAPAFEVNTVTFASGSAAITPEQAGNLTGLAREVLAAIRENPREVFLIEGHTDAVGDAAYNLALSDRRAETLALALNEYFGVPVENMVVQGYGERFLKVQTQADERANRRATVRQITQLLQTAAAN